MRIPHQSVFVVTKLGQDQSSRGTELISGWLLRSSGALLSPCTHSLPSSLSHSFSLSHCLNESNYRNLQTHHLSNWSRTSAFFFMHNHRCSQQTFEYPSSPSITSQVPLHQHPNNNTGLVVHVWGCGQTAVQRDSPPLQSSSVIYFCRAQLWQSKWNYLQLLFPVT